MTTDTRTQIPASGYAARPVTKVPDWHGLVAWDLLFNNLTTGLFLTAALGELILPDVFTRVARVAYPIALIWLLADLLCLVLDLGDPSRFHHMLRIFKPTSPMSLGTWCLTIYSFPLTLAAALGLFPSESTSLLWIRKTAIILALLPALGSALYKGVLLSTNAQPGWRSARWLGGYLANSAVMLGCAEMLVLVIFLREERAIALLRPALALLILLNLVVFWLLFSNLCPYLSRLYRSRQAQLIRLFTSGIATQILSAAALFFFGSPVVLCCAAVVLMLGSIAIRFAIVKIPGAFHDLTA